MELKQYNLLTDRQTDRQTDRHNYGIDILRVILTFEVVLCHFWYPNRGVLIDEIMDSMRSIAAPTFFLLSFVLTANTLSANNTVKIQQRIKRLIIPFYFWGFVAWVISVFPNFNVENKEYAIMALLWQVFTGHGSEVNPPLWYLAVLCWITVLFAYIFRLRNRKICCCVVIVIAIVAILSQYMGWNVWLFGGLSYEIRYPLGRITEMIPYASTGIVIWWLMKRDDSSRLLIIVGLAGLVTYLLFPTALQAEGFGYSGIMKLIGATSTVILFYTVPFGKLPKKTQKTIKALSAHTLGIYSMHYILGSRISGLISPQNQILLCSIIYASAFGISHLISRIKALKCLVD